MADIFTDDELKAAATTADNEAPQDDQGQQPSEADQSGPARDEHGRFAPKAADPEPQGRDPSERTVEHGALHAEREKRKHWEAEAKVAKEQLAAIQALRAKVAAQPPSPHADTPPPVAAAPQGEESVDQLRARLARLETAETRRTHAAEHASLDEVEHQQLASALIASETDFAKSVPDYQDATTHLATARAQELHAYGLDPITIRQTLAQEALELTRMAVQRGQSPAELAYQIAQYRGYQPKQGGQRQPASNGQGTSAVAMIEAIKRGQETSKSLGTGGGTGGSGEANAQMLANMPEDEFARLYSTPEGKKLIDSLS